MTVSSAFIGLFRIVLIIAGLVLIHSFIGDAERHADVTAVLFHGSSQRKGKLRVTGAGSPYLFYTVV